MNVFSVFFNTFFMDLSGLFLYSSTELLLVYYKKRVAHSHATVVLVKMFRYFLLFIACFVVM